MKRPDSPPAALRTGSPAPVTFPHGRPQSPPAASPPRDREWLWWGGTGVGALLAGLATRDAAVGLAAGFGLVAARQLWLARSLARRLRHKQRLERPFPGGGWHELFESIHRLQQRSRNRKRRVKRFLSRFHEAAAALPDAVVVLSRDDRIDWRNPAADALLGLAGTPAVGADIASCIRDPLFREYLAAGEFSRPLQIAAPKDRSVVLSLIITPFGHRRQRLLVARDITRAFHLDQARKDFVANVSHELRTPLTVLAGNLEILAEGATEDAESAAALQAMRDNVARMGALVEDLLALSRLEMDRAAEAEQRVDVPALLSSILGEARVLAASSGHRLHLEARPGLAIRGNTSSLRSAFSNLVHNAIRHTPPRTEVWIRWYADRQGAHLVVRDNGPGIAPRHLPRLTERFYRVDASRSSQTGGTGLGLAIVKHALERHDATLSVASREGVGTTLGCHFPPGRCDGGEPQASTTDGDAQPRTTA